jgi:hypothetical protein
LLERDCRAWRDIEAEEFGAKIPAAVS